MVSLRSSGSLGRMEMRSSSDESQLRAFKARSRFPLKPRKPLAAHCELPTTTNRPCEFSLAPLYVPAAPMVMGPFLFFGSAGSIRSESNFDVERLLSELPNNRSTEVLSPLLVSSERDNGNPVAEPFISLTIG